MSSTWDPRTYLRFADQRARPFADLMARVGAHAPDLVVDLGCGPGQLTASLADRWPGAQVLGVDSSAAMIDAATPRTTGRLSFRTGDVRDFAPRAPVDVLVSNATLQWVPGHRDLLPRLVGFVAPGGWLAFQVPGNFDQPSHRLLHELAASAPYAPYTERVERPWSAEPEDYLADLVGLRCRVDVWETTYLHVLEGVDAVFGWISGTGARPVLQALPEHLRSSFTTAYQAALREAYPPGPYGTVLPFRRIFAVAQRLPD